jgi:hypothetical protein
VGVTGHRPGKLNLGRPEAVANEAKKVLSQLKSITKKIQQENYALGELAPFSTECADLRFISSLAEGADQICAAAAIELDYRLNAILPFPRDVYSRDFPDSALSKFNSLCDDSATSSITELDVSVVPHDPKAYRDAGLLMLSHTDVLIAVWDQQPADGVGGTAEVVQEAQRRGLTIVLISPIGETFIWEAPQHTMDLVASGSWLPISRNETSNQDLLEKRVRENLELPRLREADTAELGGTNAICPFTLLTKFRDARTKETSHAIGYNVLLWACGQMSKIPWRVELGLKQQQLEAWGKTLEQAEALGGEGYKDSVDSVVRQRWIRADNLAQWYAHRFRTAFISNFFLAAFAVFVGLISLFYWENKSLKALLVTIELLAILVIIINTRRGNGGRWRDNWLDYRGLAEAIRPTRLPLLIGGAPIRAGTDATGSPGAVWAAWYVRTSLREISPPTAKIGSEQLKKAVLITIEEEVNDQIGYHAKNIKKLHGLDHKLESAADIALYGTIVIGLVYLGAWMAYEIGQNAAVAYVKPLATVLSATLPVLGAAIFGIRATGDFRSARRQSEKMHSELSELITKLEKQAASIDLERAAVQQGMTRVSRAMSEDLKVWNLIYSERDLTQGF